MQERWIKRHVYGAPQRAVLRCARGLAEICAAEARDIAADGLHKAKFEAAINVSPNGVSVENADFRQLLELTLRMTTAKDLVWRFFDAKAASVGSLKKALDDTPWSAVFAPGDNVFVKAVSQSSHVYHESLIKELVTKALETLGVATVSDREQADNLLDVRLRDDRLTLGVSLSGYPLSHRGYRGVDLKAKAPLPEDIAAGATRFALEHAYSHGAARSNLTSGDKPISSIFAPFAGSGTTGIEAWLQIANQPPSLWLAQLACERFPASPQDTLKNLRSKLAERAALARNAIEVTFVENDSTAAEILRRQRLDPGPRLRVIEADALSILGDQLAPSTFLAMNPPYGIRLGTKRLARDLYDALADRLSQQPHAVGYVLAPATAIAPRFTSRLKRLRVATRNVVHGGLTIAIVAFAPV